MSSIMKKTNPTNPTSPSQIIDEEGSGSLSEGSKVELLDEAAAS